MGVKFTVSPEMYLTDEAFASTRPRGRLRVTGDLARLLSAERV